MAVSRTIPESGHIEVVMSALAAKLLWGELAPFDGLDRDFSHMAEAALSRDQTRQMLLCHLRDVLGREVAKRTCYDVVGREY